MHPQSIQHHSLSKIYYRPLEAAIRWCGLMPHETHILNIMKNRTIPEPCDFPQWPALRLNTERIYDGLHNRELNYGKNGLTLQDESLLNDPDLTVRHIDLKNWLSRYYPDQRPDFLFSHSERMVHPTITVEAIQALLLEREAYKTQLEQAQTEKRQSQEQYTILLGQHRRIKANTVAVSHRSENTYLNIIGGMLTLMLGHSPSGQPYSAFKTQESITNALIAHYGHLMGFGERTLQGKFAKAKRHLATRY